jgi:hypothetical protein
MGLLRWLWSLFGKSRHAPASQPRRKHFPLVVIACYGLDGRAPPLHWKPCHPSTRARFKADLTCARGHAVSLKNHEVLSDGRVIPSVVCLAPGCDFHEYIRLEGWTAGHLPSPH